MKESIQLSELQALFASGMSHLPYHKTLLMRVSNQKLASESISKMMKYVCSSKYPATNPCVQIAFTISGLRHFVTKNDKLSEFSFPFTTGAQDATRIRRLKDDTTNWLWGSENNQVDLWIGIYSVNSISETLLPLDGFEQVVTLDGSIDNGREHFGFRDGISQPQFLPFHQKEDKLQNIAPGEFIFGYEDESQGISKVPPFGENGSYMVIRQLEQDIEGFWQYVNEMSKKIDLSNINLAEKMIGRSMDGYAIGRDTKTKKIFFGDDKFGTKCPLGSHVRRANLREWANEDPKLAIEKMKRHRMVRRGRSYGPAGLKSWYPSNVDMGVEKQQHPEESRGLLFISLHVDIERQFELVLHDWLQNPKFAGLADDIDPITHNDLETRHKRFQKTQKYFSIPRKGKVPLRVPLQTFVKTRGTAYFFLPGKSALNRIISLHKNE